MPEKKNKGQYRRWCPRGKQTLLNLALGSPSLKAASKPKSKEKAASHKPLVQSRTQLRDVVSKWMHILKVEEAISTAYSSIYQDEETIKDFRKDEEKQHDEKNGQDKQAELTPEEQIIQRQGFKG